MSLSNENIENISVDCEYVLLTIEIMLTTIIHTYIHTYIHCLLKKSLREIFAWPTLNFL